MSYQLVFQWPAHTTDDYQRLLQVEELLSKHLTDGSRIDGHDAGSGEVNIFVITENPRSTFDQAKELLRNQQALGNARVAFRPLTGENYAVLWPEHLKEFKVR